MTERIDEYITGQSCASICCIDDNGLPYCFSCFYSYNSNERLLYYKSPHDAHHSQMILVNPAVAGTIMPDKLNKLHVKGIQFEGTVLPLEHKSSKNAAAFYYIKNPVAVAMPGEIWTIQINSIKLPTTVLVLARSLAGEEKLRKRLFNHVQLRQENFYIYRQPNFYCYSQCIYYSLSLFTNDFR